MYHQTIALLKEVQAHRFVDASAAEKLVFQFDLNTPDQITAAATTIHLDDRCSRLDYLKHFLDRICLLCPNVQHLTAQADCRLSHVYAFSFPHSLTTIAIEFIGFSGHKDAWCSVSIQPLIDAIGLCSSLKHLTLTLVPFIDIEPLRSLTQLTTLQITLMSDCSNDSQRLPQPYFDRWKSVIDSLGLLVTKPTFSLRTTEVDKHSDFEIEILSGCLGRRTFDRSPLTLTSEDLLKTVRFNDKNVSGRSRNRPAEYSDTFSTPRLFSCEPWTVPQFAVVTARNGGGKTELLSFINTNWPTRQKPKIFLHSSNAHVTEALNYLSRLEIAFCWAVEWASRAGAQLAEQPWGESPITVINGLLSNHGFHYVVLFTRSRAEKLTTGDLMHQAISFEIRNIDSSLPASRSVRLSSGEMTFLSTLIWTLKKDGSAGGVPFRVFLLDEPDRHLDPNLIEKFMRVVWEELVQKQGHQVIMTTHRVDTIALSPPGKVYQLNENGLTRCHPLLASLRLSRHIRTLMNIHVRVFTEAFVDANVYQSVYEQLVTWRSNGRARGLTPSGKLKLVSRRYRPIFFSTATTSDGKNGGVQSVINATSHSYFTNAHQIATADPNLLHPPLISRPFGLIDRDTDSKGVSQSTIRLEKHLSKYLSKFAVDSSAIRSQIHVMNDRHSLENFLYDPFLLTSLDDAALGFMSNKPLFEAVVRLRALLTGFCCSLIAPLPVSVVTLKHADIQMALNNFFLVCHRSLQVQSIWKSIIPENEEYSSWIRQPSIVMSELSKEQKENQKVEVEDETKTAIPVLRDAFVTNLEQVLICTPNTTVKQLQDAVRATFRAHQFRSTKFAWKLSIAVFSIYEQTTQSSTLEKYKIALNKAATAISPIQNVIPVHLLYPLKPLDLSAPFNYWPEFLSTRGHDIGELFHLCFLPDERRDGRLNSWKQRLEQNVSSKHLFGMPSDLVRLLEDLSQKIRNQVNREIKVLNAD